MHFAAPIGETAPDDRLEFSDVILVDCLLAQIRAVLVGLEIRRAQRDNAIVIRFRELEHSQKAAYRRSIEQKMSVVRRESHGALVRLQGAALVAGEAVDAARRIREQRIRGFQLLRHGRRLTRLDGVPERNQTLRPVDVETCSPRFCGERLVHVGQGVRPVPGLHQARDLAACTGRGTRAHRCARVRRRVCSGDDMPGI